MGNRLALRPSLRAAGALVRAHRTKRFVDSIYDGLASLAILCYRALSYTETGRLRWYAAGIACGAVMFVAIVMFL